MDSASGAAANLLSEWTAKHGSKWDNFAEIPETRLMRLTVLREIWRDLHAEKSRLLATGKKNDIQSLIPLEKRIESLRTASELTLPLAQILTSDFEGKKKTRILPEGIYAAIPKEKFERYDRLWEGVIAAEAVTLGWNFWVLYAWVKIEQAEAWHLALADHMIPNGVVLFAENSDKPHASQSESGPLWHGRWTIALRPRYRTPNFGIHALPGLSDSPEEPEWKLIYASRRI